MITRIPSGEVIPKHLYPVLHVIGEIYAYGLDTWNDGDSTIQRIYGGANNALFKIETKDLTLACKLCVNDGRQRATREFGALRTIKVAGFDIAPQPVLLDDSKTILQYPAVIYHWVESEALQAPLTRTQMVNFLDTYHKLHSIPPVTFPVFQLNAWFHWFDFDKYLREIQELADLYSPWLANHTLEGVSLVNRLQHIIDACSNVINKSEVSPRQDHIPLRLMRVDPNTSNAIMGPDGKIRWVDWEYSGWGDPALDIAELRWHAALQPLGDEALQWLRTNYQPSFDDPNFGERLRIWDHILATRWPFLILRVLWSNHNGLDRERLSQVDASSHQLYQRLRETTDRAENLFDGNTW